MKIFYKVLLISLLSLSFGCMSRSGATRTYILNSAEDKGENPAVAIVHPVSLPRYLRRWELVTLGKKQEVRIHDFAQWGELLDEGIQRVLQEYFKLPLNSEVPVWHLDFKFFQFIGNSEGLFTVKGICRARYEQSTREIPFDFQLSFQSEKQADLIQAHENALTQLVEIVQKEIEQGR